MFYVIPGGIPNGTCSKITGLRIILGIHLKVIPEQILIQKTNWKYFECILLREEVVISFEQLIFKIMVITQNPFEKDCVDFITIYLKS